jgi:hypothetical protein
VKAVMELNKRGEFPPDFKDLQETVAHAMPVPEDDGEPEYEDVIGAVELRDDKKRRKKKKKRPMGPPFAPTAAPPQPTQSFKKEKKS